MREKQILREMTEAQIAYVAGIIDGEGLIYFNRKGDYYLLKLDVKNTAKQLLDWLQQTTGMGSMRLLKTRANRQPCWEWRLSSSQALQLLTVVQPYIVIKTDQIDIAIKYQNLPAPQRFSEGERYHREMKAMHLPAMRLRAATQLLADKPMEDAAVQTHIETS